MDANEIVIAFLQQNDKKNWKARIAGDAVHFNATNGLVTILYYPSSDRFAVKFNKYVAAWGDYVRAIARSMHVILNTLKSAGLPFEAPPGLSGIVIEATTSDDNTVFVRYVSPTDVAEEDEPEDGPHVGDSLHDIAYEQQRDDPPAGTLPPIL